MGRSADGKRKADSIHDRNIRAIDAARDAGERRDDIEGARNIGVFRGRLFDDRYTSGRDSKRVYTPKKEELT